MEQQAWQHADCNEIMDVELDRLRECDQDTQEYFWLGLAAGVRLQKATKDQNGKRRRSS